MSDEVSIITTNRRARREYDISETIEAGLVLHGTEVKSLRDRQVTLLDAYCRVQEGEAYLLQAHINPYKHGSHQNHDPMRPRKLLLHCQEIRRLQKKTEQKGFTLIPLKLYFRKGIAKVTIALARGKQQHDKRADIARRDVERRLDRTLKQY